MWNKYKHLVYMWGVIFSLSGSALILNNMDGAETQKASSTMELTQVQETAPELDCGFVSTMYDTEEVETDELDLGDWEVSQEGIEGENRVCNDADGNIVSTEVISEPQTEITSIGTYEEPEYEYYSGYDYNSVGCPKNQYVSGYVRSDGTYVSGYWRNSPTDSCY